MLYTEDFSMRHHVGFSQIKSHMHIWLVRETIYPFVRIPKVKIHASNFMIVAYGYFYLQSCNKHHCTLDELTNPLLYSFMPKSKC